MNETEDSMIKTKQTLFILTLLDFTFRQTIATFCSNSHIKLQ